MLLAIFMLYVLGFTESGRAPTWDSCGCRWLPWGSWSQCSALCGGGHRYRSRKVWLHDTPECSEFTKCASKDMGQDWDYSCNRICYHGSYRNGGCRCSVGWRGSCCNYQVACGNPGSIRNGHVTGSVYTYDSIVVYHCNQYYNLTSGTRTRKCQANSVWSGRKPRCAFVNSCASNPCQNNGTCINGLDRYTCLCTKSFTGMNCETDIQPPVMSGCHENMTVYSAEPITFINWTEPTFHDPVGKHVMVSTNYPQNSWKFPWGDFIVQYEALKPSNGLRTNCVFDLKVRPHPCGDLNIPGNGAKVCNGWKKDYGELCLVFCGPRYSLDVRFSHSQWYVCGASGKWVPRGPMPNCTGMFTTKTTDEKFRFTNSSSPDQITKMQETYLESLKSSAYSYFCTQFDVMCRKENVDVFCA
ncbi:sushi, von Willebrand factor type A, EGF and pentraxin domain-containing protein 1-like [Ostrea edulis]|uniref:sushi, von Willebrand factor type A, EGF and pentraxin domain-containing protein 1-like n=1 Tax=Ostrea edulis TaxID=37623 RepID=UPI0024AF82B8|nr:sushi, von Willebrand factor type A, EGF and pentraxin domain-containing protein 1-like [Ostrea edulis]